MASSLPLLIVSLLAADPSSGLAPTSRGPSNAERAKMGLLPRRVAPSRVTYLAEAARSRAERREFPEAGAPPLIAEAAAEAPAPSAPAEPPAAAPAAPAAPTPPPQLAVEPAAPATTPAPPAVEQAAPPTPPAPPAQLAVEQAAPAPEPAPARALAPRPARALPSQDEEPAPAHAVSVRAVPAPRATPAQAVPVRASAPPPPSAAVAPPQVAAPQVAPGASPEYATASSALVTQRFVDEEGRIVVRLLGPKARVLAERFDGDVRNLPVRWAGRGEHGEIIEIVEDAWGPIEVRRDPVGRFLFARTIDDRDEE